MVEKVLAFRPKERIFGPAERYIDPKYRKQIEDWDKTQGAGRGQKIAGAIKEVEKGNLLRALARSLAIGGEIREEIEEGDTSSFPYLLILAILIDVVDPIPIVGLIVKFVAKPILIYGTLFRGRIKYKLAARIIYWYWGLAAVELVPGLNFLPLETFSVLMLWRATAKARRQAESKKVDNNQNVISLADRLKKNKQSYEQVMNRLGTAQKPNQVQAFPLDKESGYGVAA